MQTIKRGPGRPRKYEPGLNPVTGVINTDEILRNIRSHINAASTLLENMYFMMNTTPYKKATTRKYKRSVVPRRKK
jgi:hypothetical protein